MKRGLVIGLVAALLLVPFTVRADDAQGCEGLEAFRDEIMPIGEAWGQALMDDHLDPSRSPVTFSSDDWLAFADIALMVNRDLKTVDAPDWLDDWLQVRIEVTGLQEQIGILAAENGMFVILGFKEQVDDLNRRDEQAKAAAIARCEDFEQFAYDWDALDGEVEGKPVAAR